ncbi:hypothetical protein NKG05_00815 [Oerskovia sp. M15]
MAKSAAYTIPLDTGRDRHLTDLAALSTLVVPGDRLQDATKRDLSYLYTALGVLAQTPRILGGWRAPMTAFAVSALLSRASDQPPRAQPAEPPTRSMAPGPPGSSHAGSGRFTTRARPEPEITL